MPALHCQCIRRVSEGILALNPVSTKTMANVTTPCDMSETMQIVKTNLLVAAYRIVTPMYFCFGTVTRCVCLAAFYRQYKKENAYAYQIFASISELLEIVIISGCTTSINNFAGFRLSGAAWFQRNYALMWLTARLCGFADNTFVTSSLLIYVSMAADRAFAMIKPFRYRSIDHKRRQICAITACFVLGFSTSLFEIFRYRLRENKDLFELYVDEAYVVTPVAVAFVQFRNVIRFFANVALVFLNVVIVVYYRLRFNKPTVGEDNPQRAAKRKAAQKTLFILTVLQSTYMTVVITMYNVYYILTYIVPGFANCFAKVMAPINALVLEITGIAEFFCLLVFSKQFREMISGTLRCRPISNVSSQPIQSQGAAIAHGPGQRLAMKPL